MIRILKISFILSFLFFSFSVKAQSFDEFGVRHNVVLKQILPVIDHSFKEGNVFANVRNLVPDCFDGYPVRDTTKYYGLVSFGNPNLLLNEMVAIGIISDNKLISEARQYLVLTEGKTVKEIVTIVDNASRGTHDQRLLQFLSVMKHSSMFWGNGEYTKYWPGGEGGEVQALSRNFWKVMACDAVGTLGTMNPAVGGVSSACAAINLYF